MLLNERRMRDSFVKDANVCAWRCHVYEKDRFILRILNAIQNIKNKSVFKDVLFFRNSL